MLFSLRSNITLFLPLQFVLVSLRSLEVSTARPGRLHAVRFLISVRKILLMLCICTCSQSQQAAAL